MKISAFAIGLVTSFSLLAATAIAGAVKITDLAANNAKTDGVAAVNVIAAELASRLWLKAA